VCWFTTSFISEHQHRSSLAVATVRSVRTRRLGLPKAWYAAARLALLAGLLSEAGRRRKSSRSRRTIPLPRESVAARVKHQAIQRGEQTAAGDHWRDLVFAFTTQDGNHVEPRYLNTLFDTL
jgi:hypothetical protein